MNLTLTYFLNLIFITESYPSCFESTNIVVIFIPECLVLNLGCGQIFIAL